MGFERRLLLLNSGLRVRAWVSGAFRSLHIVLRSLGAASGVFLIKGDALGFAHQGELNVDAVEELGRQDADVSCAGCNCGELGPVLGDESGVVDAKAWIEQRAGVDEVEKAFLFGAHCPGILFESLEKAEGFVFIVELVGDRSNRRAT